MTEIDNAKDDDILVIATANKDLNDIPAALVRNGRIEKHIKVALPDKDDRLEILSIYLSESEMFNDVSVEDIASYTTDFTRAALAGLVNDVLIECITNNSKSKFEDFLEPIEAIRSSGIKQKKEEDNDSVIYHELGHVVCDYALNGNIGMINVVPYDGSKGRYTLLDVANEEKNKDSYSKIFNNCVCLIGGLVATEVLLNEPYMGASSDIQKISSIYLAMVKSGLFGSKETAIYMLTRSDYNSPLPDTTSYLSGHFSKFLDYRRENFQNVIYFFLCCILTHAESD